MANTNEMVEFEDTPAFTGRELATTQQKPQAGGAVVAVEQSRAVAEVQAAMYVAQCNPRNEIDAQIRILNSCKRKSLAEQAGYAYKRGSTMVTGPTIRLAEVCAGHWGNISYGFRELSRGKESSEIEAFAWDMETNTRVSRQFSVKHWRDTSSGGYALKDERDKYEMIANQAQRRVRACILQLIPGDIVETAVDECDRTLKGNDEPMEDKVRKLLQSFESIGVTRAMIEKRLGHKAEAIIIQELVQLQKIGVSIRDDMASREEFFEFNAPPADKANKAPDKPADAVQEPEKKEPVKKKAPPKKETPAPVEPVQEPRVVDQDTGEIDPEPEEELFPEESKAPAARKAAATGGIPSSLNEKQANRIVVAMGTNWGSLAQDKTDYACYEDMLDEISAVDGVDWRTVASGLDLSK